MYVYPALYENFLSSLVMNTKEYLKRKYFKYEFEIDVVFTHKSNQSKNIPYIPL